MRSAGIYRYGERICFLTECMNWELGMMNCDPCIVFDSDESDARLGEALRQVLAASLWDVPRPGPAELKARDARFLRILGAPSWDAIGCKGAACSVEEEGGVLEFIPNRYKGSCIFEALQKWVFSMSSDSPDDTLGAAVRRGLARAAELSDEDDWGSELSKPEEDVRP